MEGKNGVEMRVGKQEARGEGSLMRMLLPTTMRCSKENMVRYLLCKMAMVGRRRILEFYKGFRSSKDVWYDSNFQWFIMSKILLELIV